MSPKLWDKIFALVDYLREHKGLRVDGIGWQAHVDLAWEKTGDNLTDLANLIDRAHAKNLSFHITENNVWLKRKKDSLGARKSRIKLKGAKSPLFSQFIYFSGISIILIRTRA